MMIDTEIRLSGDAAQEFHNLMTSVDMDCINARDEFISDISFQIDAQGVLSIDISDLNIDLSVLDEDFCEIEAVPVTKQELSVGEINIQFVSSMNSNTYLVDERNTSYSVDKYYVSSSMYSANQSEFIKFAA